MKAVLPLLCFGLLGACAVQPNPRYPSLLPRPIESRSDAEPVAPPPAPAATDPALDAQIATLRKTLDANDTAFAAAAGRAQKSADAARGAAAGSDRWITAQTALAELDGFRATTSSTLTDIESMVIVRAANGEPDYPALVAIRSRAQAAMAAQSAKIAALQASLAAA